MGPDGGSGYAEQAAVDATDHRRGGHRREAAEKARATANAVAIDAGDYPVVLEEYAVVDLLDMLGYLGFSASPSRRSAASSRPASGSAAISSRSSTTADDPAGLPMAFDYEGVAKQRVTLLERGVCRGVVYDAQTAARDGVSRRATAFPAPNPWGPFPLNMVMAAGTASRDELIGGLDRGLLVTRFHYTNPSTPSSRSSRA